ncbi:MAG: hypothetical protein L3J65_12620 [Robiginitomaculum sp.]|nr:hypothetical protein [Robiginitomaculum sp.]
MKNSHNKYLLFGFAVIGIAALSSCQSMYDNEADKFCDRIENRNEQQCTGNHTSRPPKY